MSGFKDFLHSSDVPKGRSRTINVKDSVHDFYKKTANFYGVGITTLVNNVLNDWIDKNKDAIKRDMIGKLE